MSPTEIAQAGERLYGHHWRRPLADSLGVDVSTLRRWLARDAAIPKMAELAISRLLTQAVPEESTS